MTFPLRRRSGGLKAGVSRGLLGAPRRTPAPKSGTTPRRPGPTRVTGQCEPRTLFYTRRYTPASSPTLRGAPHARDALGRRATGPGREDTTGPRRPEGPYSKIVHSELEKRQARVCRGPTLSANIKFIAERGQGQGVRVLRQGRASRPVGPVTTREGKPPCVLVSF